SAQVDVIHAVASSVCGTLRRVFFGEIQIQQRPPATAINAPNPMHHFHPSLSLIIGVRSGARRPMPLPPVFMIEAVVAPCLPPSSAAVVQNEPSHKPRAPRDNVNHTTIQRSCATIPSTSRRPLRTMPAPGTTERARLPNLFCRRSVAQPPSGIARASAKLGRLA